MARAKSSGAKRGEGRAKSASAARLAAPRLGRKLSAV
jgi:hypothetical protein